MVLGKWRPEGGETIWAMCGSLILRTSSLIWPNCWQVSKNKKMCKRYLYYYFMFLFHYNVLSIQDSPLLPSMFRTKWDGIIDWYNVFCRLVFTLSTLWSTFYIAYIHWLFGVGCQYRVRSGSLYSSLIKAKARPSFRPSLHFDIKGTRGRGSVLGNISECGIYRPSFWGLSRGSYGSVRVLPSPTFWFWSRLTWNLCLILLAHAKQK